jgi:hypothetical protein
LKHANGFNSIFGAIRGFNGESARAARRVGEEQQNGTASADLLIGLNVDERFSRAGSTVLTDALGSTVALASGASIQTQYGYDPYGVAQTTGVASTNPYQFTGRENDQTAAGLMYYRARSIFLRIGNSTIYLLSQKDWLGYANCVKAETLASKPPNPKKPLVSEFCGAFLR